MPSIVRYAWLSVAAALVTMALKGTAAWLTGSLGLLSDALESFVNLGAALIAVVSLKVAAREPDEKHPYGYTKAEYFSAAVEGALIVLAALAIVAVAVPRLIEPRPIARFDIGIVISLVAAAVNLGTALVLLRAGKRHDSIALEADGYHLLTDVWTSIGVVVGVGATVLTGWLALDPLIAIAVAAHIAWTGAKVLRRSLLALMDRALPEPEMEHIREILEPYRTRGLDYHALRTRRAGRLRLVDMHLLVPGAMTVSEAHRVADEIENQIRAALPGSAVLTHLEPIEDPASYQDQDLIR
ncbi:MAG TPA: cation diffusion facilitator family transporter [Burkholderiales bacterium]|nr:cation diffusion facilitator family transporter [Burkholderiales bacterium]